MISVQELKKSFGARRVLDGLTFRAEAGVITLLIGCNGAGKTTALRLLAGLANPESGTINIDGHDLATDRRRALAGLSFLPQAPRFHPRLTTRQVAHFYAQLRGREAVAAERELSAWGLSEFARVPTGKLSGGLRQRLALAVFALADAPVLLLDEPGLSLDPAWRDQLQEFLAAQAQAGRTILVATHLLGEWEGRADRCLLLAEGRYAATVPPDQLRDVFRRKDAPASQWANAEAAVR
ncbi:ABC transporter ATP-binding protein [Horticoccus luteus]|uniref:ABC transporter ATP-binding protein n=1 Tax=Horticoccus luteus TaxID=2862869 RepID=A0A8F9TV58_9BACT|nr:ABC transporter ATP-binding protein [Horticoccus luteus]QYM78868.1 ABC transporter ATP-binding protein [Horticoccus luteus]